MRCGLRIARRSAPNVLGHIYPSPERFKQLRTRLNASVDQVSEVPRHPARRNRFLASDDAYEGEKRKTREQGRYNSHSQLIEHDSMTTQVRLHELFDYDPETGNLLWKVARQGIRVGDVAGCINTRGYRYVCVDGRDHRAHRLVWLYHHGEWPKNGIDHIDRDPGNNRIENLRDVSRALNNLNRSLPNNIGYAGVSKNRSGFRAKIKIFGETVSLGTYDTPEEAHAVYKRVHFDLHREHSQYAPEFLVP